MKQSTRKTMLALASEMFVFVDNKEAANLVDKGYARVVNVHTPDPAPEGKTPIALTRKGRAWADSECRAEDTEPEDTSTS